MYGHCRAAGGGWLGIHHCREQRDKNNVKHVGMCNSDRKFAIAEEKTDSGIKRNNDDYVQRVHTP